VRLGLLLFLVWSAAECMQALMPQWSLWIVDAACSFLEQQPAAPCSTRALTLLRCCTCVCVCSGIGGGNDEREQTLNQLLTEMDGFEGNTGEG